jgi:hypothetical protein
LEKAAKVLNYDYLTIAEVESRHIIFALDHIREVSRGFSDNTFNHFRKYLMMLFKELSTNSGCQSKCDQGYG